MLPYDSPPAGGETPIEFAALLHTRLVTIHPFVDGNGRAARLLMNLALLQEGYPVTIIPLVLRSEYLAAVRVSNHLLLPPS